MGTRLRFGCAYAEYAGAEGSCSYGFDLDPGMDEEFPCMRVTKVCLEHDHPHDLSPAVWEKCKKDEEDYLPKGIAAVQSGAIERLTSLRKTLDYRCAVPDSFKDYLDRSILEQNFILKSWALIPDVQVRAELRRKTERILIRRENYPILPPLPTRGGGGGATTSSSRRSVPRASASGSVSARASQAPEPEFARKVKRAAPPSPEAKVSLHKPPTTSRSRTRVSFLHTSDLLADSSHVCCSQLARIRVVRLRSLRPPKTAQRLTLPDLRRLPQTFLRHKPGRRRTRSRLFRSRLSK